MTQPYYFLCQNGMRELQNKTSQQVFMYNTYALYRRPGFKVSDFRFPVCSVSEQEFTRLRTCYGSPRYACLTIGTIPVICFNLGRIVCDLLASCLADCTAKLNIG
jgi:hypothetical protein